MRAFIHHPRLMHANRRGWLAPAVAFALLVLLGLLALVVDRFWLDAAELEAQNAAESAALAAARQLVSDRGIWNPDAENATNLRLAKDAAMLVAAQNQVAGQPVILHPDNTDELRFGVRSGSGGVGPASFLETTNLPTSVEVSIRRSRRTGNPIALFLGNLTRVPVADMVRRAQATIDPHTIGIQTLGGTNAPGLPLAIWEIDPSGKRMDTWVDQIEKHKGADRYGYDEQRGEVVSEGDGIPEIVLQFIPIQQPHQVGNVALFNVNGNPDRWHLVDQVRSGWSDEDLEPRSGRFVITSPEKVTARGALSREVAEAFGEIVGQCRMVALFRGFLPSPGTYHGNLELSRVVAGRVLAVEAGVGGTRQLVFQPAVLVTHAAVLATEEGTTSDSVSTNPYLYKLHLSE